MYDLSARSPYVIRISHAIQEVIRVNYLYIGQSCSCTVCCSTAVNCQQREEWCWLKCGNVRTSGRVTVMFTSFWPIRVYVSVVYKLPASPVERTMASSFLRFLAHTQRRITVGRTPLDEWSARRRDLYLTTHNTQHGHSCSRRDSDPQSQQASGRRPTP